ncbi:MAG: orotidine-5'-phosphate decarboxylase [Flavobacteriales bacterium]
MFSSPKILVALDYEDEEACLALVRQLDPTQCRLKVGKELFTAIGPKIVKSLNELGFEVFLDLKFHDIPNTVAKAVKAAARLGVWMVNVHASGGPRMLAAAREAIDECEHKPLLIGVTVLTSMQDEELIALGVQSDVASQVDRLAALCVDAGLDGVVCSAHEVERLKAAHGSSFLTVTPGIRPANSATGDQRRVMTPKEAVDIGSDFLVIGRPITQASLPLEALNAITEEIS